MFCWLSTGRLCLSVCVLVVPREAPAAVTNRLFVCCVSRVYGGGYVLSDTVQDGACCCESKENSVVCSSDMVRGRSVWRCSWTLMPRCRMKAYVN